MEQQRKSNVNLLRIALSILALLLVSLACSPFIATVGTVTRIHVDGNHLYASVAESYAGVWSAGDEAKFYTSADNGLSWSRRWEYQVSEFRPLLEPGDHQKITRCLASNPAICFRIYQQPHILISTDGGTSWQIDWKDDPSRNDFRDRILQPGVEMTITPYDMDILSTHSGEMPVVAMGNQGMMIRQSDGNWSSYAVDNAIPAPAYAQNLAQIENAIRIESFTLVIVTFFCLQLLSTISLGSIITRQGAARWPNQLIILLPDTILTIGLIGYILVIFYTNSLYPVIFYISLMLFPISHFIIAKSFSTWRIGLNSLLLVLGSTITYFFVVLSPIIFWTVLPISYILAVISAIVLGIIGLIAAVWVIFTYSRPKFRELESD